MPQRALPQRDEVRKPMKELVHKGPLTKRTAEFSKKQFSQEKNQLPTGMNSVSPQCDKKQKSNYQRRLTFNNS